MLGLAACNPANMSADITSPDKSQEAASSLRCLTSAPSPVKLDGQRDFQLGAKERGYPEEVTRQASVKAFDIDAAEVTNAQFSKFVEETGYVTSAEKVHEPSGLAGGAVFRVPQVGQSGWWQFVEGANWRAPEGPGSDIEGRGFEPVVQVSLDDAKAYAKWAGRSIPTEAQWEYAARAGGSTTFLWGAEDSESISAGAANIWQGKFPLENTAKDGFERRAPIGCYLANAYGLYDMIGNVWEWTLTPFEQSPSKIDYAIKGGSFLCAPNYCVRYRAPARQPHEQDFSTNHIGFRTVSKP